MDIYLDSTLFSKVIKNNKIAFLDVDLTLTGSPDAQKKLRTLLEKMGYAIVFVTSRPYELVLSDNSIKNSPTLKRPLPKTETNKNGKRFHVDLNLVPAFQGILNPDAIASSTGLEIYVKQTTGEYLKDESFNVFPFSSTEWKRDVSKLLKKIRKQKILFTIKVAEDIKNYHNNKADIAPIPYRMQIDFSSFDDKKLFIKNFKKHNVSIPVYLLDDSEPEYNRYSLYIFPKKAENLKADAVDYILKEINTSLSIKLQDIHTFVSGDSYPDLGMLLYSAKNTKGIFYISGNSRLTKCFTDHSKKNYLDINITSFKKNLRKKKPGIYSFIDRTIYVADELFPGLSGAESLYQFLQSSYV